MAKKKQRRPKHVPQRSCIACRDKSDKRTLIRLVRLPQPTPESAEAAAEVTHRIAIDPTGKRNGRGAYLCDNPMCWDKAIMRNILNFALKTELTEADRSMLRENRPDAAQTPQVSDDV